MLWRNSPPCRQGWAIIIFDGESEVGAFSRFTYSLSSFLPNLFRGLGECCKLPQWVGANLVVQCTMPKLYDPAMLGCFQSMTSGCWLYWGVNAPPMDEFYLKRLMKVRGRMSEYIAHESTNITMFTQILYIKLWLINQNSNNIDVKAVYTQQWQNSRCATVDTGFKALTHSLTWRSLTQWPDRTQ